MLCIYLHVAHLFTCYTLIYFINPNEPSLSCWRVVSEAHCGYTSFHDYVITIKGLVYLTSKQSDKSISTASHFLWMWAQKEDHEPSFHDSMSQSELRQSVSENFQNLDNYSRGSNTEHSNSEYIRIPNVLKFWFWIVRFSNHHSKTEPFKMAAIA